MPAKVRPLSSETPNQNGDRLNERVAYGRNLMVASYAARFAILAMVARLQPVADWIDDNDILARNIPAIPSFRPTSSGRPR